MMERDSLFRDEALEFHTRGRETPGTVVRLGAGWLRWSYRLALALVAVGVILAIVVRTTTTATGTAVVDGRDGTFSALIPAAVAPDLRTAEAIRLELDGSSDDTFDARVTRATAVNADTDVRGLARPAEPAILLRGTVAAPPGAAQLPPRSEIPARATVVLRTERVGEIVLRQLGTMFGGGSGNEA